MNLYERIKNLRIKKGLSQEELAELVGYTNRSTIARIENGGIDIPQSKIKAFADALNTTPQELMGYVTLTTLDNIKLIFADFFFLKYNTNLSCGAFDEIMDTEPDAEVAVPIKWQWAKKRLKAFKLNGTSMNKVFYDNSIVVCLDNDNNADVYKDGTPVVVWVDGLVTFKRFYDQGENILLMPDSTDASHKPIIVGKSDNQIKVIGRIVYHVPPDDVEDRY